MMQFVSTMGAKSPIQSSFGVVTDVPPRVGMNRTVIFSSSIALALAIALAGLLSAQSAAPEKARMSQMMAGCEAMKAQKQKMQADMKAQDTQLLGEITQLKSAPEKQRVTLMAGVFTRMVEQRKAMDERNAEGGRNPARASRRAEVTGSAPVEATVPMAIDPICGMTVDAGSARRVERDGKSTYFL